MVGEALEVVGSNIWIDGKIFHHGQWEHVVGIIVVSIGSNTGEFFQREPSNTCKIYSTNLYKSEYQKLTNFTRLTLHWYSCLELSGICPQIWLLITWWH